MVSLSWHTECCPLPVVNTRFVFDFDWWKAGGPHHPIRRITVTQVDITGRNNRWDWRDVISVCVTHDILFVALVCRSLGEFVRREHVSLWGLVFPPNSPWLKKLLYENEYILTLFFHQVQSLENTQQKMESKQCIFVICWYKKGPWRESPGGTSGVLQLGVQTRSLLLWLESHEQCLGQELVAAGYFVYKETNISAPNWLDALTLFVCHFKEILHSFSKWAWGCPSSLLLEFVLQSLWIHNHMFECVLHLQEGKKNVQ